MRLSMCVSVRIESSPEPAHCRGPLLMLVRQTLFCVSASVSLTALIMRPMSAYNLVLSSYARYESFFLSLGSGTKLSVLVPRDSLWGAYDAAPSSDVTAPVTGMAHAVKMKKIPIRQTQSMKPRINKLHLAEPQPCSSGATTVPPEPSADGGAEGRAHLRDARRARGVRRPAELYGDDRVCRREAGELAGHEDFARRRDEVHLARLLQDVLRVQAQHADLGAGAARDWQLRLIPTRDPLAWLLDSLSIGGAADAHAVLLCDRALQRRRASWHRLDRVDSDRGQFGHRWMGTLSPTQLRGPQHSKVSAYCPEPDAVREEFR